MRGLECLFFLRSFFSKNENKFFFSQGLEKIYVETRHAVLLMLG